MSITIEELGFTKEELQQRVIDQLCSQVLSGVTRDDEGNEIEASSKFARELNARIEKHITETIGAIAEKHVLPNVTSFIEGLILQETDKWGQKKGQPVSFIEYLTQRADAYMREEVSYDGKAKGQSDSYSWRAASTRIGFMVNSHLQYSIQTAMKEALENANSSIAKGLEEAVKIKLKEVADSLNVKVTNKP